MGAAKHDLIVIGGGPAGQKGAAQAAYFGKRVALIERAPALGGRGGGEYQHSIQSAARNGAVSGRHSQP
jgi:succinate dehydrogenase/fumarate reductase flavoprotein subunit